MAPLAAEPFWKLLRRSGIIPREEVESLQGEFEQQSADFDSAKEIVAELIDRKVLTKWQGDKLMQGKHQGFLLGPYRIQDILGEGGMGTVFLAEHQMMHRLCAIKVLPPKQCKSEPSLVKRFYREAQAVAALDHPNIVRAYDVNKATFNATEVHYLVMEYVGGKDLQRLVAADGVLEYRDAASFIRQAAEGLAHAHERGFVHRDVKPANLLVDLSGTVKILDLGLARFFDRASKASISGEHGENVLGTADYLAPEQAINSHTVDARADIYSLGQTCYFLLTGHPPFPKGTVAERLMAHQMKSPEPIERERPDAPPGLLAVIERMIAKKADFRYQSAREVVEAIDDWLGKEAEEQDLQGFAARFQKQLRQTRSESHEPTGRVSAATEETDLELAPLEDEEASGKPGGKSGSMARKASSSSNGTSAGSSGKLASRSGARKTTPPKAKSATGDSGITDQEDPLDNLALSSPQINLSQASQLDLRASHSTTAVSGALSSSVLPSPKPRRKQGFDALVASPLFWIGSASVLILILVLVLAIAIGSGSTSTSDQPLPATVAHIEPTEPSDSQPRPTGRQTPIGPVAPPEPPADNTPPVPQPPPVSDPDPKPDTHGQQTTVPRPPVEDPDPEQPKPPEVDPTPPVSENPKPPENENPKPVEKPEPIDPKLLFADLTEFSVALDSFDRNPKSKLTLRIRRELQEAAGRAGLTISDTRQSGMALTVSMSEKDGKMEFLMTAELRCVDPTDATKPPITVWRHGQPLGRVAPQALARIGVPVPVFAPNIKKFFSKFVKDYEAALRATSGEP